MLRSLRSRLLLSYVAVIATVLVILAFALFLVVVSPGAYLVRTQPVVQQLATISLSVRRELRAQADRGVRARELQTTLVELGQELDVRILVVAAGGAVRFDTAGAAGWAGQSLGDLERPVRFAAEFDVPARRLVGPDNSRWLAYNVPLESQELGRLQLLFLRPEPSLIGFFRQSFLTPLLQSGCIAFLLAILLAWLVARSVARPLQKMAGAAEAIADGDFDQPLELTGPEEVQRVASSFNRMSAQVQATRLSQRDFVANVSHDLKTPLTSIRGWSQAILDGMVDSPEQLKRTAGIINSEAERMARLVSQLLDLARLESGQLKLAQEPIDLRLLLVEVQQNLALRAREKGIHLDLAAETVPSVTGDYDRLMQIFTNLVDNALAHTPPGGRVRLQLRQTGTSEVTATVRDTGEGISAEEQSRVFERFYQVDRARARSRERGGSGLGLAIVRELVEAHRGQVAVRSRPGRGTEFIVLLPTSEGTTIISRSRFSTSSQNVRGPN